MHAGLNDNWKDRTEPFPLPDTPEGIIEKIGLFAQKKSLDVYAVGGYVRDRLLARPFSGEIDFSVVGDAPQFAKDLAQEWALKSNVQIYKNFGTARVQVGKIQLEFATSRRESYRENSRNPITEPAPFDEDLQRRDFTINALAVDVNRTDEIIDHFDGLSDLENRILRTPLDPVRTFDDDPLRILRAIRFAAKLDFTIEEKTWEALSRYRDRLTIVARERINGEFFKILETNPPSHGLRLLYDSGVLSVIFPEIANLQGVEQKGMYHHKDVLFHSLKVLDHLAEKTDRADLRFAALVHDIGKPRTKHFDSKTGWSFHGHEHVGERIIKKFAKKYKLPIDFVEKTSRLVRLHMRPINLQVEGVTDSAVRRLIVQAGDQIDDLLMMCRADITSGNKQRVKTYLSSFDRMVEHMASVEKRDELKRFQSPIRGDEIMKRTGLKEGPRVGLIKALIEEAILDGYIEFTWEGADSIFDETVEKVQKMEDDEVYKQVRSIMRYRSEGMDERAATKDIHQHIRKS